MRVGFAGTPDFADRALAAVREAGHTLPLVLTQPDRPHGRGLRLAPSPVKSYAVEHGLPVLQPASLKAEEQRAPVLAIPLDVLVVAAYGLILPPAVLAWPCHGCLNIHASRLPRWRGAAPIARAIEAGDAATGVTIMQMDAGLDTGPMIDLVEVPIAERETAGTLHDKLAAAGAAAIVATLARLARDGHLDAVPQPAEGVTYAAKIDRAEAALDWQRPAVELDRRVRAFDPAPGAHTTWEGKLLKIGAARPVTATARAEPGTVLAVGTQGIDVASGEGTALRVATVKPGGGRWMEAAAFAAGHGVSPGARFGPT
jgi:methionyl-tRNA formyltransferase